MATIHHSSFVLYSDYRSSCAARVRIALNLKAIPFEQTSINLYKSEQFSSAYTALNPSASVPTLIDRNQRDLAIGQSVAALEYLEDIFPRHFPLLPPPSDPIARAHVRTLVQIIASDTQPPTNTRVQPKLETIGMSPEDRAEWNRHWFRRGLAAYDEHAKNTAGRFSVGGHPTLADCCLVPAVWNVEKAGMTLDEFPTIKRVYENLSKEPAVEAAHWRRQADCPEELRDPNVKVGYGK